MGNDTPVAGTAPTDPNIPGVAATALPEPLAPTDPGNVRPGADEKGPGVVVEARAGVVEGKRDADEADADTAVVLAGRVNVIPDDAAGFAPKIPDPPRMFPVAEDEVPGNMEAAGAVADPETPSEKPVAEPDPLPRVTPDGFSGLAAAD